MARTASISQASRLSTLTSIAIAIAALYVAQEVLIPIALSVLLAFILAPLVTRLERTRLPRIPSVLIIVGAAFIVIMSIGYVVGQQVYNLAEELPHYSGIKDKLASVRGHGAGLAEKFENIGRQFSQPTTQPDTSVRAAAEQMATGHVDKAVATDTNDAATTQPSPQGSTQANPLFVVPLPAPVSPVKTLGQYLGLALGSLATGALVLVFVVFILLEREDLRDRLIRVVSHGRYTVTTRAIDDATTRISRYMLAQSMVNGSYGVIIGIGLAVIGLTVGHGVLFPSFVLWGLLSATLRFIPYLGAWIAASFPIVLSLAVYPGFSVFVAVVILLAGIELITNNVMEPWLYAASTGLSTMAVLIAAVFWTWLWGPVGLLLSTPLTVCIVVLGKHVAQLKFLDVLLGDQAALPPAVSFYQRLLAGDRSEAMSIVKDVARERGGEFVADDVLIPSLLMARRDRRDDDLTVEKENLLLEQMTQLVAQLRTDAPSSDLPTGVFGVPAHHRAEELPLNMLSELLGKDHIRMDMTSTRMLPSEVETAIGREQPGVVFIAVLPPGGIVQARYLCRRLHRRFPELKIVVGYWGKARNFDQLLVRFRSAGASYVTTSLLQARSQIAALLPRVAEPAPMHEPMPAVSET